METRLKYLSAALYVIGVVLVVVAPALMMWVWTDAFTWEPRQTEYEQMIMGFYAVLGVFLIIAARDPLRHRSLIWFTVWSSVVHGGIMLVQALADEADRINLLGDIPALLIGAAVLAALMPRGAQATARAA